MSSIYAVFRSGGFQYTVRPGDVVQVPTIAKDLGAEFDVDDVLMIGGDETHVGKPTVSGAKVTVVITKQTRTRKVIVFKKKRRHSYRNFNTHRQEYTELFIKAVAGPGGKSVKAETEPNIVDVAAKRDERLAGRAAGTPVEKAAAPVKKKAKAATPKKAAKAKKKTTTKKKTAKKAKA